MSNRYQFTRPKTKQGDTDYLTFLRALSTGGTISSNRVRTVIEKHMTYQAMREKGLVSLSKGTYSITPKGKLYVDVVDSANVTPRSVLRAILNTECKKEIVW